MNENELAKHVVDSAFKVHTTLGPGLLESVYEVTLAYEIRSRGIDVERQVSIPIVYENLKFEEGFRADIIVAQKLIVEVKAIDEVHPKHKKQLLTHLTLTDTRLGLLINFDEELIKHGIHRVANDLPE